MDGSSKGFLSRENLEFSLDRSPQISNLHLFPFKMSSSNPNPAQSNEKTVETAQPSTSNNTEQQQQLPQLGALDEDDEFEEFEQQGDYSFMTPSLICSKNIFRVVSLFSGLPSFSIQSVLLTVNHLLSIPTSLSLYTDWDSSATTLSHLKQNTKNNSTGPNLSMSGSGSGADHLWEDNWDDDDVEDDFSKALR